MATTMSESMVEMGCKGAVTRVPDHTLLHWQVVVDWVDETKKNERESGKKRTTLVPSGNCRSEEGRTWGRERMVAGVVIKRLRTKKEESMLRRERCITEQ